MTSLARVPFIVTDTLLLSVIKKILNVLKSTKIWKPEFEAVKKNEPYFEVFCSILVCFDDVACSERANKAAVLQGLQNLYNQ